MNKKILSMTIAVVMAAGGMTVIPQNEMFVPVIAEAATRNDEMIYENLMYTQVDRDDDGTYDYIEITDCYEDATEVEIPAEIGGLPVESVSVNVFYYNTNIKSVIINEGVTSIENESFSNCINLESVTLPDGITSLGGTAFSNCISLKNINIPEGVTSIGHSTFSNCISLETIILPDSISKINAGAFNNCRSLKSINIPASLTSILDYAFNGCASLETISVSEKNSSFCEIDGVLFSSDKTTIIEYPASKSDAVYSIPDGVNTLELGAFDSCQYLEVLEIPDSLERIWESALDASSFKEINVSEDNPYFCSVDGVLFNKEKTRIVKYPGSKNESEYIIPEGVTDISEAFSSCVNIETVEIPESLTLISYYAFSDCSSLKKITLPKNITCIAAGSFQNCSNLDTIIIENPMCEFYSYGCLIYNGINENDDYYFNGTIYGYDNSTAQAYAEEYGYNFKSIGEYVPAQPQGDITGDGELNLYDAIDICKCIMGMRELTEEEAKIADYNSDGKVDLYDAIGIAKWLMNPGK